MALASSAQKAIWTRQLTTDLGSALAEATTILKIINQGKQSTVPWWCQTQSHHRKGRRWNGETEQNKIHTEKIASHDHI